MTPPDHPPEAPTERDPTQLTAADVVTAAALAILLLTVVLVLS